jgi:hypothetical protein
MPSQVIMLNSFKGLFERKNSENAFFPSKRLNQKTNCTIRKCSSRAFQWMVVSVCFDNLSRPEKINSCDPVTRIRHKCGFIFIICHNPPLNLYPLLRQNSWYLCMPFDCSAVSRTPEFRLEFRDVTNSEWHMTDDVTSRNTCRGRHRSDIALRYCIVMTSWNSGPNSGALETAAQQWGLSPDQHFVWSDIFITRQIGILGRAIFLSCIFAYFS